jgi:methyl-accepting chemotaxis protein
MSFIAHLKIKYKLALILLFPLLGLSYFSITLMIEKAQRATDTSVVAELTQFSINLSHVVHTIQLERGASSLFLKNKGQKFSDELSQYRIQTDESVIALKQLLDKLELRNSESDFNTRLDNVLEMLARIKSIRADVTTQSIQQPKAVKRYTEINQTLFEFLIHSSHSDNYKDDLPL